MSDNRMNVIFHILVVILSCLCVIYECSRVRRVVGGSEVECGKQPRVASLRNSTTSKHLCGATIVSAQFALTAAHCVDHDAQEYVLLLNNYCDDGAGIPRARVFEVIVHPLYDRWSRAHDIAILRIQLPHYDVTWLDGSILPGSSFGISGTCTIYGYGTNLQSMAYSEVLMGAEVKITSLDYCKLMLGVIGPSYKSGMVCALGRGTDSCHGDSGSPLMCGESVQGISSHGQHCAVPGVPGVYTSVGAHLAWIRHIVDTFMDEPAVSVRSIPIFANDTSWANKLTRNHMSKTLKRYTKNALYIFLLLILTSVVSTTVIVCWCCILFQRRMKPVVVKCLRYCLCRKRKSYCRVPQDIDVIIT